MVFTKEEAVKKMLELGDGKSSISAEQADAILTALGKDPRAYYPADAESVNLKADVLDADKTKTVLVDGGFATDAEVEAAKTALRSPSR